MPKLSKSNYRILDDDLLEEIGSLSEEDQADWLVLTPHEEFPGRWFVDSLQTGFFFDFEEIIGSYRTVSPARLPEFLEHAQKLEYKVAFEEDPFSILNAYEHLNDKPPFELHSDLDKVVEGTGMFPFQIQGFNKLKNEALRGGKAIWSTGTGKAVLITALTKWHIQRNDFDIAFVVVKTHNKHDMAKKLMRHGDIDSIIIEGTKERREATYAEIEDTWGSIPNLVVITNYEKFREDEKWFKGLIHNRRLLIHWDEMPTRLRTRSTQIYKATCGTLYKSAPKTIWKSKRPSWLRQYEYTATPIENSPMDEFNCTRLIDPDVFPSLEGFEKEYVAGRDYYTHEPDQWHKLDKMGLQLEFMTHQVDKKDPDIAAMFPAVVENDRIIDWHPKDRKAYDRLQQISIDLIKQSKEDDSVERLNVLELISVLQMLCDAPSMAAKSAENHEHFLALLSDLDDEEVESLKKRMKTGSGAALRLLEAMPGGLTDQHCAKMADLNEILTVKHPDEKALVYMTWSEYGYPPLEAKLSEWGIPFISYRGTEKQRREAKEKFRTDSDIQVFLSSDAGSDSIDLPEASVGVNYNLPWKWATFIQRQNRKHRIDSIHSTVYDYTLLMDNSVEKRKVEIISKKLGFHNSIYKGAISEGAISARLTPDDLYYMLLGDMPEED